MSDGWCECEGVKDDDTITVHVDGFDWLRHQPGCGGWICPLPPEDLDMKDADEWPAPPSRLPS